MKKNPSLLQLAQLGRRHTQHGREGGGRGGGGHCREDAWGKKRLGVMLPPKSLYPLENSHNDRKSAI